ncbi:hypothetical protein HHI36_013792 [Cryptolaemus montrouzieri]|uniref:Carboxylic ester hydrolase n=1 Tax=Cryptolaemus montrouzieri TaxID=559131 RepID=A0ABD2NIG4_9CUCU
MISMNNTDIIISICIFIQLMNDSLASLIVNTENGMIEGSIGYTVDKNKTYYAFQSIPYAKPPIDNLRFQAPQPIDNWEGVLPTIKSPNPCVQTESDNIIGDEDCLYLNIYTPQLPEITKSLLPVMVWIYGGGFEIGSSEYNLVGPDYFLDEDVIFVAFNYRLGIFGFLSLGDLVVPGNNGLKDQSLALKWIKNNILNFGGDSNQITVFGHSAGSVSISYHLQSPLSKNLFNQVIMESGTSYCLWGLSRIAPDIAKDVALSLNIDISSSKSIVNGLIRVNATFLQKKAMETINLEIRKEKREYREEVRLLRDENTAMKEGIGNLKKRLDQLELV